MRRIRRAVIVLLGFTAALLTLAALALQVPEVAAVVREWPIGPGPGPTPEPPVITAPAGPLPAGPAGLTELAQYGTQRFRGAGCGFLLRLPSGSVIGVTTAHSVAALGQPGNNLQNMAFALPGSADHLADFSNLYGEPGVPFSGDDLSVDYVLLRLPGSVDAAPALAQYPDARGAPQPGERVALYSGLGGQGGPVRVLLGTVMSSAQTAAWLLMDEDFDPGGMSGSPVVSAYTGRVVGMAVGASRERGRVLIGINPIGGIVQHALAAHDFPTIASFNR